MTRDVNITFPSLPGDEGVGYAINAIVKGGLSKGPAGTNNQVICLDKRTDARRLVLDDN